MEQNNYTLERVWTKWFANEGGEMMQNKSIYVSLFSIVLVLSLAGCSSVSQVENTGKQESKSRHDVHWSYDGETGSNQWGTLDSSYSPCLNGTEQSPINIDPSKVKADPAAANMQINYKPAIFSFIHNGHTIQANPITQNNSIVLDGKEYPLVQFHFHKPSEHQLNGKESAVELHLVHKNEKGKLAVLGVLLNEDSTNEIISKVWAHLPKQKGQTENVDQPINLIKLLPENKTSFRYNGSLTTPPCSEGVKWIVFENTMAMSKEQVEAFGKIFPDNHRPVQPINVREVMKDE